VTVGDRSIIIQDNGGGIATDTIKSILDYSIRVSSREAYVSPTRGAQGNALKTITVKWPSGLQMLEQSGQGFKRLAKSYVWFNPHLTLRGIWHGEKFLDVAATNPTWEKWSPRNPTSPHWYDETRLQRYLAAHVSRDRDLGRHRTVRAFIAEFRGLS